jgi:hypothetical protein
MPFQNIWCWPQEFNSGSLSPFWTGSFEAQIPAQTVFAWPSIQRIKNYSRTFVPAGPNFEVNAYVVSYTTTDGVTHPGGAAIISQNVDSVTFGWWVTANSASMYDVTVTFQILGEG